MTGAVGVGCWRCDTGSGCGVFVGGRGVGVGCWRCDRDSGCGVFAGWQGSGCGVLVGRQRQWVWGVGGATELCVKGQWGGEWQWGVGQ